MAEFLSDDWYGLVQSTLDEHGDAGDDLSDADAHLRLQFEIAGTPDGKVRPSAIVHDGRFVRVSSGKVAKPHCKVICDVAIAEAMLAGDLDPNVAYMRGDLKLDGEYARVLYDLRPILRSESFQGLLTTLGN